MPTQPIVLVDCLYNPYTIVPEKFVPSWAAIINAKQYLTPEETFSLYILSDCYSSKRAFDADCLDLIKHLQNIAPFNLIADNSLKLVIYSCYTGDSAALTIGNAPYSTANATSGMGAYYSTATSNLQVDYSRVSALVQATIIRDNWPLAFQDGAQALPGAIVVLLPRQDSTTSSVPLSMTELGQIELEHSPTDTEPLFFAVTSVNYSYERVIARAIGVGIGLGNEFELNPGAPSVEQAQTDVRPYPNLVYAPYTRLVSGPVEPNFQWRSLIGNRAVEVHNKAAAINSSPDNSSTVATDSPIELWEGGGGYSNNVYRAAQTCIMRQRPGLRVYQAENIKEGNEPFCPYCQMHMRKVLRGDVSTKRGAYPTLTTQRSEYERVHWLHSGTPTNQELRLVIDDLHESVQGVRFTVTNAEDNNTAKAFWGYTYSVNGVDGFVIDNLNVFQGTYLDENGKAQVSPRTEGRDVIRRLRFTDLAAVFDDNTTHPFDIAAIIGAGKSTFAHSWQGDLGDDTLYQAGMKLSHVSDDLTLPELEFDLSVVLRRAMDDFDPGRTAVALTLFPQITFRWALRPGVSKRVVRFEGRAELTVSVKHYHKMAGMGLMPHTPTNKVDSSRCSLFSDSNLDGNYTGITVLRREDLEGYYRATRPTWASIFDYYQPDVTGNGKIKSFTAVHGPLAGTRYSQRRRCYVDHRIEANKTTPVFIRKMPRQGAYDNIHVMGDMGMHGELDCDPSTSSVAAIPMVAAPFCGVDCLHMHWRWATLTDAISQAVSYVPGKTYHNSFGWGLINAESYKGWSGNNSHTAVGSPLVPPNHGVIVTLQETNSTDPTKAGDKLVLYATSIYFPQPDVNHVTMEQGLGWAMTYGKGARLVEVAVIEPGLRTPDDKELSAIGNRENNFRKIYDFIRFHHNYKNPKPSVLNPVLLSVSYQVDIFPYAQVPDGADTTSGNWPIPALYDGRYQRFLTVESGLNIINNSTIESS